MSATETEFAMEYLPAILWELRARYDRQGQTEPFPEWVGRECLSYTKALAPKCSPERLARLTAAIVEGARAERLHLHLGV